MLMQSNSAICPSSRISTTRHEHAGNRYTCWLENGTRGGVAIGGKSGGVLSHHGRPLTGGALLGGVGRRTATGLPAKARDSHEHHDAGSRPSGRTAKNACALINRLNRLSKPEAVDNSLLDNRRRRVTTGRVVSRRWRIIEWWRPIVARGGNHGPGAKVKEKPTSKTNEPTSKTSSSKATMRSSTSAVEFSASAVSASAATVCGSQTGRSQQPRYDGSHDEESLQVRHDVLLSLFYRSSGLGRRTSVGPEIGS
jgi:hypothetical protein